MPLSLFKRQRHDLPLRYHSCSGFPALVTAVTGRPGAVYYPKGSVRSSEVIFQSSAYCLASTGSFLQAETKELVLVIAYEIYLFSLLPVGS